MKCYFRVAYNILRIYYKKIFKRCTVSAPLIQSLSRFTELNFGNGSVVNFGNNIQTDGFCRLIAGENAQLAIGNNSYFNNGCVVSAMKSVTIGNNCLFGPNVMVFDNNHTFSSKDGVSYNHKTDNIEIGDNCWIAAGAIILKGTHIGSNCVIGAGCKVSGNIPDGSIVTCSTNNHINAIEDR